MNKTYIYWPDCKDKNELAAWYKIELGLDYVGD